MVTYNRNPILIDNIELLKNAIKYSHTKFDFNIFAISIMPEHLHMILKLNSTNDYPKIIYSIKYYFSKHKWTNKNFLKVKLKMAKKVFDKEDIGNI